MELAEIITRKIGEIEAVVGDPWPRGSEEQMADMAIRQTTLEEKLAEIDKLCQEVLTENRVFIPMYPWVFVLVCKKEQKVGSIWTPDNKQNKPTHEGIVLATWQSKTVERGHMTRDGVRLTRCEVLHSDLRPGDRVLFPHWAGKPVPGYDTDRFRVVRETNWSFGQDGGIFARIEIHDEWTKPVRDMLEMIGQTHTGKAWPALAPEETRLLEEQIGDRYVVVDREVGSLTLSGV